MISRNVFTEKQEAWLKALESGEFQQVQNALCNSGGMCCLGVATHVVDPKHNALKYGEWSRSSYDEDYSVDELNDLGDDGATAPPETVEELMLNNSEGKFRFGYKTDGGISALIGLNDSAKLTFPEIAAFIRERPWVVFVNFDQPETAS